jgi:hypothetical protein
LIKINQRERERKRRNIEGEREREETLRERERERKRRNIEGERERKREEKKLRERVMFIRLSDITQLVGWNDDNDFRCDNETYQ